MAKFTIELPENVHRAAKIAAAAEGLSLSNYIIDVLRVVLISVDREKLLESLDKLEGKTGEREEDE